MVAPNPHTTGGSGAAVQEGVDALWKHQLRKEHATLLEKLDASNKTIEAVCSETNRKFNEAAERLTALEAKVTKTEAERKNMRQAVEKWHYDVASLKAQMGILEEKHVPAAPSTANHTKRSSLDDVSTPKRVSQQNSTPRLITTLETSRGSVLNIPISTSTAGAALNGSSSDKAMPQIESALNESSLKTSASTARLHDDLATLFRPPLANGIIHMDKAGAKDNTSTSNASTRNEKAVRSILPRARQLIPTGDNLTTPELPPPTHILHAARGGTENSPSVLAASTHTRVQETGSVAHRKRQILPELIKIPTLSQRTSHLQTYYKNASAAFVSLPINRQMETQFIMKFLKGLRDSNTRDALTTELQTRHPYRSNHEGKLEILCEWADVADALRSARLISLEGEDQAPHQPVKKKQKILIPQELVESGLLRR